MASAFTRIMALMDAEALAGIAMPAWASAFSSKMYKIALNANVLAGIAKPARASASISVNIIMNAKADASIVPKGPQGLSNLMLGTGIQKTLRAFWDEARHGFGVH